MKIGVIDYGSGNLASLANALEAVGAHPILVSSPAEAAGLSKLILPGVGSFRYGMEKLEVSGMADYLRRIHQSEKYFLGICLGMQLMCEEGLEDGVTKGLGLQYGRVEKLKISPAEQLPHVGWNSVYFRNKSLLTEHIRNGSDFYFVHSYGLYLEHESVIGETEYPFRFVSIINPHQRVFGTQFHPEKSSKAGLQLIKNFCEL
jgi:glutamine amidotransferase